MNGELSQVEELTPAWGGLDTLHILAGVPSTRTLLQISGVDLIPQPRPIVPRPKLVPSEDHAWVGPGGAYHSASNLPTHGGLEAVAAEARACSEINFVGTVLALAAFIPLLAVSSASPVVHHLSSVAATIAAPSRCLYSATKAAALMAVESARVECEGAGVRFFCKTPPDTADLPSCRVRSTTSSAPGPRGPSLAESTASRPTRRSPGLDGRKSSSSPPRRSSTPSSPSSPSRPRPTPSSPTRPFRGCRPSVRRPRRSTTSLSRTSLRRS